MSDLKPRVDARVEETSFASLDGSTVTIGATKDRWTMLFVYRGRHCPRCKRFLNKLNANLAAWTAKMDVIVVSSDTQEKAQGHIDGLVKKSWKFSSIPLLILIIGYSFAPQLLFFWGLFSLFGLAWIWCSTYNTNTMIKRYIQETFVSKDTTPPETEAEQENKPE